MLCAIQLACYIRVIKDGAGRLDRILFVRWGHELDCELKQFWLAGDLVGIWMDGDLVGVQMGGSTGDVLCPGEMPEAVLAGWRLGGCLD